MTQKKINLIWRESDYKFSHLYKNKVYGLTYNNVDLVLLDMYRVLHEPTTMALMFIYALGIGESDGDGDQGVFCTPAQYSSLSLEVLLQRSHNYAKNFLEKILDTELTIKIDATEVINFYDSQVGDVIKRLKFNDVDVTPYIVKVPKISELN